MFDKKTILILISIASIVAILVAIIIIILKGSVSVDNTKTEQNNLYFVTQNTELTAYGVCKTDGTVVLDTKYSQIARVEDTVYLKTEDDSSIFSLKDGTNVSLGGKESGVYFAYDTENKLLPYYILRYGESQQTGIYRIYTIKGLRYDTRDFSTLNEVYEFLNAKEIFKSTTAPTSITDKYNVKTTLEYPSSDGKTQYVVTKMEDDKKLVGLVDESGRVILDIVYNDITPIDKSENAIKVTKDGKTFVFTSSEKFIEVESGFEFETTNGYLIQKKGTTVNKIYNLSGEVVIDGIYNIKEDLTPLNSKSGVSFMIVPKIKGIYSLYNITSNIKSTNEYSDVVLEYMGTYSGVGINTAFIYKKNETYYAVDLDNLKSYKMNIKSNILSPLDLGVTYKNI